jgi:predicted aldo/keto reductase-like oxidoreductase
VGIGGIPIQRPTVEEAKHVIWSALDLGINFIDTSIGYGDSELRIGEALKGRRDDVIIATKGSWRSREQAENTIKGSLQRLGVDYIDLWQFHNVPTMEHYDNLISDGGALEAANEALDEGKIRHLGITSHNLDVALKATASGRFETIQFPFNFISDEAAMELIPLAKKQDVGFIGMKPFAGGNITDAGIAFRYLLQYDSVLPDPGVEKIHEVEEIVNIIDDPKPLSELDHERISKIRHDLGNRFCRQCLYCMPCPQGVNIWMTMITKKMHRLWPLESFKEIMVEPIKSAGNCVECGACEEKCPYGLPIREMLKENTQYYEQVLVEAGP